VQRLAREPKPRHRHVLTLRHRLHDAALMAVDPRLLDDQVVEADAMCRNAREKRRLPNSSEIMALPGRGLKTC
jgi:hypothetical protein